MTRRTKQIETQCTYGQVDWGIIIIGWIQTPLPYLDIIVKVPSGVV